MRDRLVAGAMALGVVVGAVAVGVLAVADVGEDGPEPLPVLGVASSSAGAGTDEVAEMDAALVAPGPVEVEVAGDLPSLEGEAAAWRVGGDAESERVERLAAALGVSGSVEDAEHAWVVDDGTHRLEVQRQPGLPWWYGPAPDVAVDGGGVAGSTGSVGSVASGASGDEPVTDSEKPDCVAEGTCIVDPPMGDPDDTVVCDMPECPPGSACIQVCPPDEPPEPPADKPSQDQVREAAAPVLAAAGTPLDAGAVRLDDTFTGWSVSVDPLVGGLPTVGMTSSVTVGPDGIEYAGGWLTEPEEGDTYPLIGTSAALTRFESQGAGGPMPLAATEPMLCQDDGSGGCVPAEPIVLRITGARLGLQLVPAYEADEAWLVPAYLFEVDGGGPISEIPVFAIGDEHLTEPPAEELPPGCELVGGDAIACEEPGSEEPAHGEPGATDPSEGVAPLPDGEKAEVGVGYYLDVYTHCGVREVEFDGRWWDADPPLGDGSAPTGWAEPTEGGTFTLLSPDEAEFVGDADRAKVARFVARPPGEPAPPPCR